MSLRWLFAVGFWTQTALAGMLYPIDFTSGPPNPASALFPYEPLSGASNFTVVLDGLTFDLTTPASDLPADLAMMTDDAIAGDTSGAVSGDTRADTEETYAASETGIALASGFLITLVGVVARYWQRHTQRGPTLATGSLSRGIRPL